jgi:DNA-binding winged helix-turn-helix (wHTH) protein
MRTRNSNCPSDPIDAVFAGADSRVLGPRSASIRLLSLSNEAGQGQRKVQGRRVLRNEVVELLTDIDGLPVLVRLLIEDVPAEMQAGSPSKGGDIHSLLSIALEKMVDRMGGSSVPAEVSSKEPLATVELISNGESLDCPPAPPKETVLRVGPLELDLLDRSARRGDRKIDLRPREFELLKYMMRRSDKVLERSTLLREVWRYRFVPETNLVDVHMGRLRRKVDGSNEPPLIRNVRGVGFVLSATQISTTGGKCGAMTVENQPEHAQP